MERKRSASPYGMNLSTKDPDPEVTKIYPQGITV